MAIRSDGVMASLGEDRILDLSVEAGLSTPRGGQMFSEAVTGSNVNGIRGNVAGGMNETNAAACTFTGKLAIRAGATRIRVVTNNASEVVVEFTK